MRQASQRRRARSSSALAGRRREKPENQKTRNQNKKPENQKPENQKPDSTAGHGQLHGHLDGLPRTCSVWRQRSVRNDPPLDPREERSVAVRRCVRALVRGPSLFPTCHWRGPTGLMRRAYGFTAARTSSRNRCRVPRKPMNETMRFRSAHQCASVLLPCSDC